jgi:hypothetical protein
LQKSEERHLLDFVRSGTPAQIVSFSEAVFFSESGHQS